METTQTMAAKAKTILGLNSFPVGVKFIFSEKEIPEK